MARLRIVFCLILFVFTIMPTIGQTHIERLDTLLAGENLILEFNQVKGGKEVKLHCHTSLGSVVLTPIEYSNALKYQIPDFMSQKAGKLSWFLSVGKEKLKYGVVTILPQHAVEGMETYLGPPTILAGGVDYTMFVSVPTDVYDNTMLDSTQVDLEYYFKENTLERELRTEKGFVFKRIFSPNKSGRIFAVSKCRGTNSKEYDVNVQPGLPVDFTISTEEHHGFADGNQITTFITSVLVDSFNNVVANGTMVEFYIKNKFDDILRTRGITIDGIAKADMLHPEFGDIWKVRALVSGMAISNEIEVEFKQVVSNFEVAFHDGNRRIVLGPIKSYMKQLIPDGFKVDMMILQEDKLIKREIKSLQDGMVTYRLDPNEILEGEYTIHFKVAGLHRVFEKVKL